MVTYVSITLFFIMKIVGNVVICRRDVVEMFYLFLNIIWRYYICESCIGITLLLMCFACDKNYVLEISPWKIADNLYEFVKLYG